MISGGKNDREVHLKIKETHLINSLKKELKELQISSKTKTIEIENIKKNIKTIKINDLNLEIISLTDDLTKTKSRFESSLTDNIEKDNYIQEYKHLQEVFSFQQSQLISLSEEVKYKEENSKIKEDEITNMRNFIKEKDNYLHKINKNLKIQKKINEKKSKEEKVVDLYALQSKIVEYERKIPDLQAELSNYKKETE